MNSVYSKCKADPMKPDFVEQFKALHPVFNEPLDLRKITERSFLSYVVLTYDIESPLVIKYQDWAQRRRETARICKFPQKDGEYIEEAENIIFGINWKTNRVILYYLFLQNDLDFINAQISHALLFKQTKEALFNTNLSPNDSAKLKKNIDELTAELKSLQKAIFHGDETVEMKRAFYDFISQLSLEIRPEDIAERKQNGEEIVDDSPYDDYKPETMKFVNDE